MPMKNKHNLILLFLATFLLAGCGGASDGREAFVRAFFERYPQATLQDIYKGSFQDTFGPAHLLTNRESVKNYILHEMKQADSFPGEDYVPCGWQGNFLQVNLKVIADGRVPIDVFVDAFMAGANGVDTTLTPVFLEEWQALLQTVRRVHPHLAGFAQDSTLLARLLGEGQYVVHHSQPFNDTYHPHYRIIRRDVFEELIQPHL